MTKGREPDGQRSESHEVKGVAFIVQAIIEPFPGAAALEPDEAKDRHAK